MPTDKRYLRDMHLLELEAQIVMSGADDRGHWLIFDQTVFYPKSGGQPSDIGRVYLDNGDIVPVLNVQQDGDDVLHFYGGNGIDFAPGQIVRLCVDQEVRDRHAKLHSAGEVICAAIHNMGLSWVAVGAIHEPGKSHVAFDAHIDASERDSFAQELLDEVDALIRSDTTIEIEETLDRNLVQNLCGFDPEYLPSDQPVRLIRIVSGFARPCGGTHVSRTSEVGGVSIRSIKTKKRRLIIGYDVD